MSGASVPTVVATLKSFCSGGIQEVVTLKRNPNSDTARLKATGEVEAQIVATACSSVPATVAKTNTRAMHFIHFFIRSTS